VGHWWAHKRVADESPKRVREGNSRCEFLGRVTRSAAGCRVYIPLAGDDKDDCPGRILNDVGTFTEGVTVRQECGSITEGGVEGVAVAYMVTEATASHDTMTAASVSFVPSAEVTSVPSSFPVTSMPDLPVEPTVAPRSQPETMSTPDFSFRADPVHDVPVHAVWSQTTPATATGTTPNPEHTRVIVLVDEFGRDTCVVNEVCQMIDAMPQPWSAYRAFEAATARSLTLITQPYV